MEITKRFYAKHRREWRSWLAKHHKTEREIWLVYYTKASGKPRVAYSDAVEEALCYGWIDGQAKSIDQQSWGQRFSPRRAKSKLSALNRERVRRLIAARKMTKAGLAAIAHEFDAKQERAARKKWKLPSDIAKALKQDPEVWKNFRKFPAAYREIRTWWIDAARPRRETFEQRLRYFLKMTKANKRFGTIRD